MAYKKIVAAAAAVRPTAGRGIDFSQNEYLRAMAGSLGLPTTFAGVVIIEDSPVSLGIRKAFEKIGPVEIINVDPDDTADTIISRISDIDDRMIVVDGLYGVGPIVIEKLKNRGGRFWIAAYSDQEELQKEMAQKGAHLCLAKAGFNVRSVSLENFESDARQAEEYRSPD